MDHDPDLRDPSDGGREEEWAGHQTTIDVM